jgi:hypothetical protein
MPTLQSSARRRAQRDLALIVDPARRDFTDDTWVALDDARLTAASA